MRNHVAYRRFEADKSACTVLISSITHIVYPEARFWQYITCGVLFTNNAEESISGTFVCGNPTGPSNLVLMGAEDMYIAGTHTVAALGLVSGDSSWMTFGPGSPNWLQLAATPKTSPGVSPTSGGFTFEGKTPWYESAVWDMELIENAAGNQLFYLVPYWVNPDKSVSRLSFAALPDYGILYLTGDFDEFSKTFEVGGAGYTEVFLVLA